MDVTLTLIKRDIESNTKCERLQETKSLSKLQSQENPPIDAPYLFARK